MERREAPFLGGIDYESIWIEPLAPPTLRRTHQQVVEPKVVCHLDSRAVQRVDPFSLFPQNVPDFKCTHLVYAAATIGKRYSRTGCLIGNILSRLLFDTLRQSDDCLQTRKDWWLYPEIQSTTE